MILEVVFALDNRGTCADDLYPDVAQFTACTGGCLEPGC